MASSRRQVVKAAVVRGNARHPSWAAGAKGAGDGRYTWYAALRVRADVRGDVSDLTLADVDDRVRVRTVTVALLKTVKTGAHAGELRRVAQREMLRDFDELLDEAVQRHSLIPAGRQPVQSVFRHKEA